jgi:hypothetical protein
MTGTLFRVAPTIACEPYFQCYCKQPSCRKLGFTRPSLGLCVTKRQERSARSPRGPNEMRRRKSRSECLIKTDWTECPLLHAANLPARPLFRRLATHETKRTLIVPYQGLFKPRIPNSSSAANDMACRRYDRLHRQCGHPTALRARNRNSSVGRDASGSCCCLRSSGRSECS